MKKRYYLRAGAVPFIIKTVDKQVNHFHWLTTVKTLWSFA